MSGIATAVVGGALVSGYMGSKAQKKAANTAANAQIESSEMGVEEQRRQFDAIQKLLKPYVDAGTGGLTGQQDLLGINGNAAQQAAINNINNSSEMQTYLKQGENAILQNASATGGLRGGNTQAALAQFRPQLLNQLINQRYQNYAGLTALGQNAAAGTGNAGMQTASNIQTFTNSLVQPKQVQQWQAVKQMRICGIVWMELLALWQVWKWWGCSNYGSY